MNKNKFRERRRCRGREPQKTISARNPVFRPPLWHFVFWNLFLIYLFVFYLYFLHGFSRPSETSKTKAGRVLSVLCSNGKLRAIKGSLISIYYAFVYPYLTYGCVL